MKPVEASPISFRRWSVLVGAAIKMVAKSFALAQRMYSADSSTGRSRTRMPSTPARRATLQNFSIPMRRMGFRYVKITRPVDCECSRISAASFNTCSSDVLCFRARSLALWITGPSATGSLKGTPSSIVRAPALIAEKIISRVVGASGSPQVT